jgi:uncharacterized linocin/CFP29 family protein
VNHLLRPLAPITERGWERLDEEARRQFAAALAARRLVDFSGPHGWEYSAVTLGRVDALAGGPVDGVSGSRRRVAPVIEQHVGFAVAREELEAIDRGAEDPDLEDLRDAARRMALAENTAVFHGWLPAGLEGIADASPHEPVVLDADVTTCPTHVARAVELLLGQGIGGPYGMALGPSVYTSVVETTEHGGYPLFEHLRDILGGPLVWAPGVDGAVVLSLRGGDFALDCGQDLAIGYAGHDDRAVELYIVESFAFRVAGPDAAVALPAPAG